MWFATTSSRSLSLLIYISHVLGLSAFKSFGGLLPPSPAKGAGGRAVGKGDRVLVVGGTGGVGQLITRRLAQNGKYKVSVLSRNPQRGLEGDFADLQGRPGLEFVEGNTREPASLAGLSALREADAVVICTGTSAFPSKKWEGGNSPQAVDVEGTANLLGSLEAENKGKVKRIVYVSSIGVERTGSFPFVILNAFGVLDCKREAERRVVEFCQSKGATAFVCRPGRLIGGPYTNPDVNALLRQEGGSKKAVQVARGDALAGDVQRVTVAEAVVQCLELSGLSNSPRPNPVVFSMVNEEGPPPTENEWVTLLKSVTS